METATAWLRRSIGIIPFLILLNAPVLPAQEGFPATHVLLYRRAPAAGDTANGIGIIALDHVARSLQYRASFNRPQTITGLWLIRNHKADAGEADTGYDTLLTAPISDAGIPIVGVTFTGRLSNLSIEIIGAIDSGVAELHFNMTNYPDESLGAAIEIVPSAYASDMAASNETTAPIDADAAGGRAQITVDRASRTALYMVHWYNLTGPATAAHFHKGARGSAGPPIHTISLTGDSTIVGVWTGLTDADLQALANGEIYVNVHTTLNPNGEIREQMDPIEVFTAAIETTNEVPPVSGSPMSGTGVVFLQSYGGVGTYLSARVAVGPFDATAAHIHRGATGQEGDVIMPLEKVRFGDWQIEEDQVTSLADLALMREGNTYLNFHTEANPEGEARGQLIPSPSNLTDIPLSSVPRPTGPDDSGLLQARVDPRSGIVRFTISAEPGAGSRRIMLYDMTGSRVADLAAEGTSVVLESRRLARGVYFARLIVDARIIGSTPVIVP
jgi:hypothetical protein